MIVGRKHKMYYPTLARYMNTKEGQAFALDVISQLVSGFKLDKDLKIKSVKLDTSKPLNINIEEEVSE